MANLPPPQPQPGPNPNVQGQPNAPLDYDQRLDNFVTAHAAEIGTLQANPGELAARLDTARDNYASAIAQTSGNTFRGRKERLENAREEYTMWHGVASLEALEAFENDPAFSGMTAGAQESVIREFSAMTVLGARVTTASPLPLQTGQTPRTTRMEQVTVDEIRAQFNDPNAEAPEATRLAERVERARLQKAGYLDAQGNEVTGIRKVYNKVARKWAEWGPVKKTAVMVGVGLLASTGVLAVGAAAGAGAAAGTGAAVAISKAAASARLRNKGSVAAQTQLPNLAAPGQRLSRKQKRQNKNAAKVTQANLENQRTMGTVLANHETAEPSSIEEVAVAFHGAARKKLNQNRRRAAIAAVLTGAAAFGGAEWGQSVEHGVEHAIGHYVGHDVFGKVFNNGGGGKHPVPAAGRSASPSPSTSRPAASTRPAPGGTRSGAPGSTGNTPAPGTGSPHVHPGSNQPGGEVSPTTGQPQPFEHFNVDKTADLHRVWATGTNANEMTHFVNEHGHLEVRLENFKPGETIVNGHAINNLTTNPNVKVAVTFNTPNGPETIFVPMHNGVAVMPEGLGNDLTNGVPMTTEIVIQHGASEHLQVLSTVVGQGHEVSGTAFNHLVQSGTESTPAPAPSDIEIPGVHGVPQSPEVTHYENELYRAFAKTQGGISPATRAEFNVALAEAVKHNQVEFVTGPNGHITAIIPDGQFHDMIWQPADGQHIQAALQHEVHGDTTTGSYAIAPEDLSRYSNSLYEEYLKSQHLTNSAEVREHFNAALQNALKGHRFEVMVNPDGSFQAIAPDPAFNNEIWENVPPSQILSALAEIEEQAGALASR